MAKRSRKSTVLSNWTRRRLSRNYTEGDIFFSQHDYRGAIAQEEKTLEIDPNSAPAYSVLHDCYDAQGMYDKAVDAYERLFALSGAPALAEELKRAYATSGVNGVGL